MIAYANGKYFKWGRRGTPQNAYISLARFVWGFKNQNIPISNYIGLKWWKPRMKANATKCRKARSYTRKKLPSPTAFGSYDFFEMTDE